MSAVAGSSGAQGTDDRVRATIASWRDALVNLTGSNRLLNFKPRKTSAVTVSSPAAAEVLHRLAAKETFVFRAREDGSDLVEHPDADSPDAAAAVGARRADRPVLDVTADAAELRGALRNLQRRSNQEYLDRGLWILYLAVGSLAWTDEAGTGYTSPLLLRPVELVGSGRDQLPDLRAVEEDSLVNPALSLRLADTGIALPAVEDLDEEDLDVLLDRFRQALPPEKGWTVSGDVVLSYFTFAKEAMYRDLLENEAAIAAHPGVRALAAGGRGDDVGDFGFDEIPDAEIDARAGVDAIPLVLDADSSQRATIAAAVEGRSFVMDGPPGTGKSQTIANMIGALLHAGRSVLFVSEKAAALDVVRNRLTEVGLGDYLLELHSHKATRKQVAEALGQALDTQPDPRPPMGAVEIDQLRRRQRDLNDYAHAMNAPRAPLDHSLHTVLGWIAQLDEVPSAPATGLAPGDLTVAGLGTVRGDAKRLASAWRPAVQGDSFLWWGVTEKRSMQARLYTALRAIRQLHAVLLVNEGIVEAFDLRRPSQAHLVGALLSHHAERPPEVPGAWLTTTELGTVVASVRALSAAVTELRTARDELAADAGTSWSSVPARDALPRLDLTVLTSLRPGPIELEGLTATEAAGLARELGAAASMLRRRQESLSGVAALLGLPPVTTFADADALLETAAVASAEERPERWWLTDGVTRAENAARELRSAIAALHAAEVAALPYFTPSVLDIDVVAVEERLRNQHLGLRKLRAAYRADRKLVTSCTTPGTGWPEARRHLPLAVSWKKALDEQRAAEVRLSGYLGVYYTGRATDFGRVERVLDLARAVERNHGHIDLHQAAALLSREARPDPVLAEEITGTRSDLTAWRAGLAPGPVAAARTTLLSVTMAEALTWLDVHAAVLGDAAAFAQAMDTAIGATTTVGQARQFAVRRETADRAAATLLASNRDHRDACGELYAGDRTDLERLDAALRWAGEARSITSGQDRALSHEQVAALESGTPVPHLMTAVADWTAARQDILSAFDAPRRAQLRDDLDDFDDATNLLEELQNDIAGQDEWFAHAESRTELARFGLNPAVEFCIAEEIAPEMVPLVLEKALLHEWADHHIATDPALRTVRAEDRTSLVEEYRDLDRRAVSAAVGEIVRACDARRPPTTTGPASVIRREADKKRKHMPVRELIQRSRSVTQAVKPCFMMSPLAVSQYLPSDLRFDVVIFDEASQVAPQDAINCIYRGSALITAGDQKQLPPTTFFAGGADDGDEWTEESEDAQDFESILDLAKASGAFKSLTLRWHYRSRHEDLIAFSNASFYMGRLITFPGAEHRGPDVGVELFDAGGTYRRGSSRDNPIEARKVAERVLHHYTTRPELSVGVVTFSDSQKLAIEAALEDARRERPELDPFFEEDRLNGFFVKSLESVQGDERDVMIFSIGYGPDEIGKMSMNFGPLNRAGGWRRLNVAITRARYRNEIVSSIQASDITAAATSEGVRHLRRYLDYAARGVAALALDTSAQGDAESPFEESVISAIRSWGYDVTPQVGAAGYRIDIGVHHPDHPGVFVLAVECDGYQYHSSKVARDRDRLRDQVLVGLGWTLHRIWGTAWYRNRAGEEARLRARIENAVHAPIRGLLGGQVPAAPAPAPGEPAAAETDAERPWTVPYAIASVSRLPAWVDVNDPSSSRAMQEPITEIARVEGPVHIAVVRERLRAGWNKGQLRSRVQANIDAAIRASDDVISEGSFIRSTRSGPLTVRTPTAECRRTVDQIHPDELALAIVNLVRDSGGMSEDELAAAVARLLGWHRRGPEIAPRVEEQVSLLLEQGVVTRTGHQLSVTAMEEPAS